MSSRMNTERDDAARRVQGETIRPRDSTPVRAHAGRPSVDPHAEPGTASPKRQVRLPQAVSDQIDTIAAAQGRSAAEVMREAITRYVQEHHNARG